jgi:hypothetical protein
LWFSIVFDECNFAVPNQLSLGFFRQRPEHHISLGSDILLVTLELSIWSMWIATGHLQTQQAIDSGGIEVVPTVAVLSMQHQGRSLIPSTHDCQHRLTTVPVHPMQAAKDDECHHPSLRSEREMQGGFQANASSSCKFIMIVTGRPEELTCLMAEVSLVNCGSLVMSIVNNAAYHLGRYYLLAPGMQNLRVPNPNSHFESIRVQIVATDSNHSRRAWHESETSSS